MKQVSIPGWLDPLRHGQAEARHAPHATQEAPVNRHEVLFDLAPVGYFVLIQEDLISEVNLLGARLLGIPRDTQVPVSLMSLVAQHDREHWAGHLASLQQEGPPRGLEVEIEQPGGARINARLDCVRQAINSGQSAVLVTMTDVTASKQIELKLTAGKAALDRLINSVPDAIISTDARQTIVTANLAAARMFLCSPQDMVGASLERFMPERFRAKHQRDMLEFGATETVSRPMGRSRDVIGLRSNGEEFPIDVAISHRNLDGNPLYTAILRDITERRRIEAELRSDKAALEAALSSMSDAVFISDVHGRFLHLNQAFATFHKFSNTGECLRTLAEYPQLFDVFLPNGDLLPLEQWAVPRALRGESATGMEYRLRRTDTGQSWIGSYNFAPIRSHDGTIVGAVVTGRDVTELKQKEAELASAHADLQRLIAAQDRVQEAERKRIAQDLHDDLQQTLAAIRMDVAVIEQKLAAEHEVAPILKTIGQLIQDAISATRRIVNDLQPHVLEELGLVPALEVLAEQFSQRTGIACQLEAPGKAGDASPELSCLATPMYRIVQEALNNVIKHAQARAVQLRLTHRQDGQLILRIADNGMGMSVSDRKKSQSFGLLGMQERVRAIGGTMRIESERGAGTSIEVVVPPPSQLSLPHDATRGPVGPSVQDAIDASPGNIAVLDPQGTILWVNRAWRVFAKGNGDPTMIATGPGINYLAVCRRSAQTDEDTRPILKGLQDVLNGSRDAFMAVYPCHSAHEHRWFLLKCTPLAGGQVKVTHLDVSHLTDLVRPSPTR